MFDLVIHDGLLISPINTIKADLGISNGKIAAVGNDLEGVENIDAAGLYVLPGAVDPHVHLQTPVGQTQSSDDWQSGSIAALCGGTTTVIDFVEPAPGQLLIDALNDRIRQAEGRAVIDFAFHMTLMDDKKSSLDQLPALIRAGCTSFKTYLTYEGFRVSDEELIHILEAVKKVKGLVMVHAENDAVISYLTAKLLSEENTSPEYHPLARPAFAESEAIQRALSLAEAVQAPVYIVHISTAMGARALKAAQLRGVQAFGETCPQYLLLTDAEYQRADFESAKFVCSPPLRKSADNEFLWDSLGEKTIQTVGTDHCPFFYHGQKDLGRDNFSLIPGGLPGIESRLTLLHTFGVLAKRISLERWVEVCCTAPAQIFGLFPQKGSLEPGSDADVVLFDPHLEKVITQEMLHENADYTPYEGLKIQGFPHAVIVHGKPAFQNGVYSGISTEGKYLFCQVNP